MFIFNVSLNKKSIKKAFTIFCICIVLLIIFLGIYFIKNRKIYVKDEMPTSSNLSISASNYSDILKDSYANIDSYVGKTIKFTGFVYRLYDFSENQFVLGREMITKKISETQAESVVIGFLCEGKNVKNYSNGSWVEIEGKIEKGYYHAEVPIIKINKIKETTEPIDKYINEVNYLQEST